MLLAIRCSMDETSKGECNESYLTSDYSIHSLTAGIDWLVHEHGAERERTTQHRKKKKINTKHPNRSIVEWQKKRGTSTFGAPMGATDDRGERIQMKKSNASPALVMVKRWRRRMEKG